MSGEQTVGDAVVGERDGHENQNRHCSMNEVGESNLVPVVLGDVDGGVALEHGEAVGSHEAVEHFPVGAAEAVGEVEEEAGERAEAEEDDDHGGADGGAVAFAVHAGEDHLEGE